MLLNFNQDLTCDEGRRIISGKIVPFDNEIGNTSAGKVIFEKNSIIIHDTAKVKLLLEHDPKMPIGRAINFTTTDEGITASFKIAETTRGNDSLVEASQDLRSGLSVGVEVIASEPRDGILYVSSAKLIETSLVWAAAFPSAAVTSVAASEPEPELVEKATQPQPTESEASVDNATPAPEVEAAKVEASRPTEVTARAYAEVRSPIITGGNYLEHTMRASLGDYESAQFIRAADDSFSTNTGFDRPNFISQVIDISTKFGRPTVDAFGGTTDYAFNGLTVTVPKVTTNQEVGIVAENGVTTETNLISGTVSAPVQKFAGMGTFSQELIDLQHDPIFYDTLLKNLAAAYAKKTNEAVIAKVVADGTLGTIQAATAAGFIAFHSVESVAAYLATGDSAKSFIMGGSVASLLIGAVDTTGRPIFNSIGNTANAGGSVTGGIGTVRGDFLGLNAYLDRGMVATTIDDSAFIVVPEAMLLLEQPPQKLMVAQLGAGQYELSLHGYMALVTQVATGYRRFNIL